MLLARVLRTIPIAIDAVRSRLLISWLRASHPGLTVGKGVVIQPGTKIGMLNGATMSIGDRTVIQRRCALYSEGNLSIGSDSFIGAGSTIVAVQSVTIGDDALVAANVTIRDQNHATAPGIPYRLQALSSSPILIGANVWVGVNSTILRGVTIGAGAVVAAGAVVTKDVISRALVAGVPAKLIREL